MNEVVPVVHLVDDDESFLIATARLLRASGFSVRAFTSARDLLSALTDHTRGCVIVDLRMPELSGLDVQAALGRADNPLPIIFFTGHGDIETSVRAMRDGAEDFLEKRTTKKQLLDAVERSLARDAREHAKRTRLSQLAARLASLTTREREVLAQVVQGKQNKQIAADLGINERTVKLHRTAITRKLRVWSVAELTRLVQEAEAFTQNA